MLNLPSGGRTEGNLRARDNILPHTARMIVLFPTRSGCTADASPGAWSLRQWGHRPYNTAPPWTTGGTYHGHPAHARARPGWPWYERGALSPNRRLPLRDVHQ